MSGRLVIELVPLVHKPESKCIVIVILTSGGGTREVAFARGDTKKTQDEAASRHPPLSWVFFSREKCQWQLLTKIETKNAKMPHLNSPKRGVASPAAV